MYQKYANSSFQSDTGNEKEHKLPTRTRKIKEMKRNTGFQPEPEKEHWLPTRTRKIKEIKRNTGFQPEPEKLRK